MTEIDRRLHRAGSRLREMPVEIPPLESLGLVGPAPEPPGPEPRAAARVPAAMAGALLVVGTMLGYGLGHTRSEMVPIERIAAEAAPVPAPTAADRMRDPLLRGAGSMRAADEIALMSPAPTVPRRQVRWS